MSLFYGPKRSSKASRNEKYADKTQTNSETLLTERKLFMIECRIEILNLRLLDESNVKEKLEYYENKLEEVRQHLVLSKIDVSFVEQVIQENSILALEYLKIKVLEE